MCTDARKVTVWEQLRQRDLKIFARFLPRAVIAEAAQASGARLGIGVLCLANLVWLAIGCAWQPCKSFGSVLLLVLKLVSDVACGPGVVLEPQAPSHPSGQTKRRKRKNKCKRKNKRKRPRRSKHDPRGQGQDTVSEEAYVQARRKMPWSFWLSLIVILARNFEQAHPRQTRWHGFRLLALDGSCIRLPHWRPLIDHFGTAKGKKNAQPKPQARLVILQYPLARITKAFEVTPITESELSVGERLLQRLEANDLVLLDRGFWSYGVFWQIQNQGAFFATRRKAGVKLPTVKVLGPGDRLVRYRTSRRKWLKRGLPSSLNLRVISYQIAGFRPSAVVTNVLDPQVIARDEWVRMATVNEAGRVIEAGLYHRRWEIETTFRELKVVQGLEAHLRGRTPETIRYEIASQVLLHLLIHWLMVEAAEEAGLDDPLRLSFKRALEELLDMRQTLLQASPHHARTVLIPRLLRRIASHPVPLRPGRHYPRPHDTRPKYKGRGRYRPASKLRRKRT